MRLKYVALAAGALALSIGCSDEYATLSPTTARERFSAPLAGSAEVPPVTTQAAGTATVTLYDSTTVRYEVTVANINAVTAAHIHAGTAAQSGPVMVFLYSGTAPTAAISGGVLRQGDITPASRFTAPFTYDSLVTRIRAGTAYVNVHTSANPGGEIRGQLAPATPTSGAR